MKERKKEKNLIYWAGIRILGLRLTAEVFLQIKLRRMNFFKVKKLNQMKWNQMKERLYF